MSYEIWQCLVGYGEVYMIVTLGECRVTLVNMNGSVGDLVNVEDVLNITEEEFKKIAGDKYGNLVLVKFVVA